MSSIDRRTFLRLGLGFGLASLVGVGFSDLFTSATGNYLTLGLEQMKALMHAIQSGTIASVPLNLRYLGTVRVANAPTPSVHYHVYETTDARTNQEHGALYFLTAGQPIVAPTALGSALHPEVPGKLTLQIHPFDAQDARYHRRLPDGRVLMHGASLATLHKLFGGPRGVITDPALGKTHQIDITPWADLPPHRTYLNIAFYFRGA